MKTYRGKISYILPILFIPIITTVGAIWDGELLTSLDLFFFMWLIFLAATLIPKGYKLEIEGNFIQESFCGIKIKKFQLMNVQSVSYGKVSLFEFVYPVFSVIHGKGVVILANIKGNRKIYSLSEKLYGEEALEQLKLILMEN